MVTGKKSYEMVVHSNDLAHNLEDIKFVGIEKIIAEKMKIWRLTQ